MGVGSRQYRSSFTSKIVGDLSRPLFRPLLTGSTSVFVFGSGLRLYHERFFGAARTSEQQEALVSNQEFPDNTYQVRLYIMCCWCLSCSSASPDGGILAFAYSPSTTLWAASGDDDAAKSAGKKKRRVRKDQPQVRSLRPSTHDAWGHTYLYHSKAKLIVVCSLTVSVVLGGDRTAYCARGGEGGGCSEGISPCEPCVEPRGDGGEAEGTRLRRGHRLITFT